MDSASQKENAGTMKKNQVSSQSLVVFALHYVFFVSIVTRYGMGGAMEGVFRYALPGYLLLIFAGFVGMTARRRHQTHRLWFIALAFILLPIMWYRAYGAGEETLRIVSHTTPYLLFSLIFVKSDNRFWKRLNQVFVIHTAIGSALMILDILAISYGTAELRRTVFYSSESNLFLLAEMLYAFPFLLLTWDTQNSRGKATAIVGACAFAAAGIVGQFRGMFFLGFLFYVPFAVLFMTWHRGRRFTGSVRAFVRAGMAASVGLVVLLALSSVVLPGSISNVMFGSFYDLLERSGEKILSEEGSWRDEPRWKELMLEVLPQITRT
ncbi:unnamed protein product, partial [marine sediment metagenome]